MKKGRATEITPEHMEIIREYGRKARESLELRGIHWWPEPENCYDDPPPVNHYQENSDDARKGEEGEERVAEYLQEQGGWYVNRACEFSGRKKRHAPMIESVEGKIPMPDLDISRSGERKWAEVKTKARASFTRITNRFEHGIPLRQWKSYFKIQKETGCSVWIFIFELFSGHLLYNSIDILSPTGRLDNSGKMDRGGMIFFPRDAFELMAILLPDGIWADQGKRTEEFWAAQEAYDFKIKSNSEPAPDTREKPHSEEIEALRSSLFQWASRNGFREFPISPGETIKEGGNSWGHFCRYARPPVIRRAASLLGLEKEDSNKWNH